MLDLRNRQESKSVHINLTKFAGTYQITNRKMRDILTVDRTLDTLCGL